MRSRTFSVIINISAIVAVLLLQLRFLTKISKEPFETSQEESGIMPRSLEESFNVPNSITLLQTEVSTFQYLNHKEGKKKMLRQEKLRCGRRHKVLDQIRVANTTSMSPSILCFIMSCEPFHQTRVDAVLKTWGHRCDKLVVVSNKTDADYHAISLTTDSSYTGLWTKLNKTMQYVWEKYRNQFDWVFKADDDTYVIVENLKELLRNAQMQNNSNIPLIFGRRYSSPRYRNLKKRPVYFGNLANEAFGDRFYKKMNPNGPVIYNYGGAGFAMNWPYVEKFLQVMKSPDTVFGNPPEDQAHGVVMAYHDIWPQKTRDEHGRERFHPESPATMYDMEPKFQKLWNISHIATGGLSVGDECCSEESISFHHIDPQQMENLERYLYECRGSPF